LAVWYLAGLKRTATVRPTSKTWQLFGLSQPSAWRSLNALEAAGLVSIDRGRGRCPLVTIKEREQ
jgi:hypothetical protein